MIHDSVLSTIGHTPLVRINRLYKAPGVEIVAKLEYFNPGGSVKDRLAMALIDDAEKSGQLTPDKTIIEATSGNTGIGLSMVCAVKGYKLLLIMPESASEERRRIMRAYGAEFMLTPGHLSTDGAIDEAYRLAREYPEKYVLLDQFNNPAGVEAHYRTTGQEMWDATSGQLTHAVMTLGTSGTAMGVAKKLKELNPNIRVIAVEPKPGHKIQGLKNMQASYTPGIYDKKILDQIITIEDEEAYETSRRLAKEEGIFVGMSAGAAMAAAIQAARELENGLIVTLLPDGGERYLSTPLFAPKVEPILTVQDAATAGPVSLTAARPEHNLYTVGPAMDDPGEIEAWRRICILETLARFIASKGLKTRVVVSLADLDDRTIKAAKAAGLSRQDFSDQTLERMKDLTVRLGLNPDLVRFMRAGDYVAQTIALCRKLLLRGAAYEKLGSIYFDVVRFEQYGSMSRVDLDKLSLGKTVDLAAYAKENPKDFTLLKRAILSDLKTGDYIKTEWGNLRPSWFMQHAAVALENVKDISLAMYGAEHVFPHMENFRAIWSLAGTLSPLAWLVCGQMIDKTNGRSLDQDETALNDLKMLLLSVSYHKPLVLSRENLTMWRQNWTNLHNLSSLLGQSGGHGEPGAQETQAAEKAVSDLKSALEETLAEDIDLPHFWPVLFQYAQQARSMAAADPALSKILLDGLKEINNLLGLLDLPKAKAAPRALSPEISSILKQREAARQNKDFALADQLRERLRTAGVLVRDTAKGQEVTIDDASGL